MMVDVVIHGADEVKLLCSLHEVMITSEVMVNYVKLFKSFLFLFFFFPLSPSFHHLYFISTYRIVSSPPPFFFPGERSEKKYRERKKEKKKKRKTERKKLVEIERASS